MLNCTYTLKLDKEYVFSSEKELNTFIAQNKVKIALFNAGNNIQFSMSDVEAQLLDAAKGLKQVKEDAGPTMRIERGIYLGSKKLKSVSKLIQESKGLEGKQLVPVFILANYKKHAIEALTKAAKLTDSAVAEIDKTISSWTTLANLGTDVHSILQKAMDGEEVRGPIGKAAEELREQLENDGYTKFLTEIPVTNGDVVGIIDLLAIKDDGTVAIYDYKTSYKDPAEWSQTKDLTIAYQLAMYRNLLESQGITVNSINIIPIELEVDLDKKKLLGATMGSVVDIGVRDGLTPTSSIVANVDNLIPNGRKLQIQAKDNTGIIEMLRSMFNYSLSNMKTASSYEHFVKGLHSKLVNGVTRKFYMDRSERIPKEVMLPEEEAEAKAEIEKYLQKLNEQATNLPKKLVEYYKALKKGETYDAWGNKYSHAANHNMYAAIRSYVEDPTWTILEIPELEQLGLVGFYNSVSKSVEFVSVTNNRINDLVDMSLGTTILSNYLSKKELENDDRVLDASIANIEAIKAVLFFMYNDSFKDVSLGKITVVNEYTAPVIRPIDQIQHNILRLKAAAGKDFKLTIRPINTTGAIEQLISYITGLMNSDYAFLSQDKNRFKAILEAKTANLEQLIELQRILYKRVKGNIESVDDRLLEGLIYSVDSAIRALSIEFKDDVMTDIHLWGNLLNESRMTTNPNNYSNKIMQAVVKLVEDALNLVRIDYVEYKKATTKKFLDLFNGTGMSLVRRYTIGDTIRAYENLFEIIDGKKTMRFKQLSDPSLNNAEKDFIKFFMEQVNEVRMSKMNAEEIDVFRADEARQREIPLMYASTFSKMVNKSLMEGMRDYWDNMFNTNREFKDDAEFEKVQLERMKMSDLFSYYENPNNRQDKLLNTDTADFEMNLELVLDTYMMNKFRVDRFNAIIPILNSLKSWIVMNETRMFNRLPNLLRRVNEFIDSAIFNKNLLPKESEGIAKAADVLTTGASALNLGLNPQSGLNELLAGFWNNLSTIIARKVAMPTSFGKTEWMKAMGILMSESVKNINMTEELNALYGMANMDTNNLVKRLSNDRTGIIAFKSRFLYMFNQVPDYFNRMSLLIAQMIKDDCYKAHSIEETESGWKIVYDEKKDGRFHAYFNARIGSEEYLRSKSLYDSIKTELAKEDGINSDGTLKRAYTSSYRNSIKEFADSIHGAYDHQSKIAFENMVFGRLLGQFKRWMLAKKNRYYTGRYKNNVLQQYKQYRVKRDAEGNPIFLRDDAGNIIDDPAGTDYITTLEGTMMEGIWQTLLFVGNELKNGTMSWDDLDETRKFNLTVLATDTTILAMMALLVGLADMEELEKDNKYQAALLQVMARSTNDLFLVNNLSGYFSAKNPIASIGYTSRLLESTYGVLTGSKDPTRELLRNVGILRPFYIAIK